jgi:4-alpha-glucanotransferase
LKKLPANRNAAKIKALAEKQLELNKLPYVDYVEVVKTKLEVLKDIFSNTSNEFLDDEEYKDFFHANKYWLMPYAAFCYLRDKYQTSDFSNWEFFLFITRKRLRNFLAKNSPAYREISFHYFRAIPFA